MTVSVESVGTVGKVVCAGCDVTEMVGLIDSDTKVVPAGSDVGEPGNSGDVVVWPDSEVTLSVGLVCSGADVTESV